MKQSILPTFTIIWLALFLAIPTLLVPTTAQAEITSIADAINKSGRQRMLSQRILSTYYQVGKKINLTKSQKQLAAAISLFESQLNELKAYSTTTAVINRQRELEIDLGNALQRVFRLWDPVKEIVTKQIERSKAEELRELSEKLLKASHAVVLLLQELSGTESGRLVNIAGRQRMLSQRLSSLYILQSWGFSNPTYEKAYLVAIKEYRLALDELKNSSINTRKIARYLLNAEKYFKMFEHSNSMKVSAPSMLRRSAAKMLKVMNDVTMLYQIESEKLQQASS